MSYFKPELQCYRWVQITDAQGWLFVESYDGFSSNYSYNYTALMDDRSEQYCECHVDHHSVLLNYAHIGNPKCGGNLSVRRNKAMLALMIIVQDESTFHQYIFANKSWKSSSGINQIMPKSIGDILMVSGYQAREFGLGFGDLLSPDMVSEINKRRDGTEYLSTKDVYILYNSAKKGTLLMIQAYATLNVVQIKMDTGIVRIQRSRLKI
jgi:hypothetical protein